MIYSVKTFLKDESGAAMVEFAIVFPMMLLIIALIWEGGRIMWGFQSAIAGVRDANRYLSRAARQDVCINSVPSAATFQAAYETKLNSIVQTNLVSANNLLPSNVTLKGNVAATFRCVSGSYSVNPAAVGKVAATITISLPFKGLLNFMGGSIDNYDVVVADEGRIYGL